MSSTSGTCTHCNDRGWRETTGEDGSRTVRRCDCRRHDAPARRLERTGIPARYRGCRLDSFSISTGGERVSTTLHEARARCEYYVENFLESDGSFKETGLIFIGRPGVGKTHLAVGVLRELVLRYGVRGRFADFTTLLHEIQSTFDPSSPESKRSVLDPVQQADVLVLDELGAQKPTPWVSEILYLIINSRYAERRPTLFTTNYPMESRDDDGEGDLPLGQRIPARLLSRLYEMATPVLLDQVADFRREMGVHLHFT